MKVRASLAAAAALLSLGSPALAQAPLPVPIWTGAYLGAFIGAIGGDFNSKLTLEIEGDNFHIDSSSFDDTSWLGGAQAGYDFQNGNIVFGAVGDWMATDLGGSHSFDNDDVCVGEGEGGCIEFYGDTAASLDWLATFRGKLGLAHGPFLFYVTGGLAIGKVKGEYGFDTDEGGEGGGGGGGGAALPVAGANGLTSSDYEYYDSGTSTEVGFAVGAGAAMQFTPHLIAEITYLHVDLGTADLSLNFPNGGPGNGDVDFSADLGRFALSYKF
jgi:outer membrane immunogenic protein